jgi:dihydrofolate reductase
MGPVEIEISMSVDGFITGPNEEGAGLGDGGEILHAWFHRDPDRQGLADDALFATSGAVITSRKVYDGMEGWGDTGFYRMPVFVLTHRPHDVVVKGETTFTFVTEGIESAIAQARGRGDGLFLGLAFDESRGSTSRASQRPRLVVGGDWIGVPVDDLPLAALATERRRDA